MRVEHAAVRSEADGKSEMNRLYVVEGTPTITGAVADHRLRIRPSEIESAARSILAALQDGEATTRPSEGAGEQASFVSALAADLREHRGRGLVIAGDNQPPAVHALAHAMNAALDNVGDGRPVRYTEPVELNGADGVESLRALVND